jgi:hypothetical protein
MWGWIKRLFSSESTDEKRPELFAKIPHAKPGQRIGVSKALKERLPIASDETPTLDETPALDETPKIPDWAAHIPERVIFLDVETTGLSEEDRVVSFGAIGLSLAPFITGTFHAEICHLIFDPGRRSHPKAEETHGFDDWTLRHQEPFAEYAEKLREFISSANLIVAHNAEFDLSFMALRGF